jgi:hypothetical protein
LCTDARRSGVGEWVIIFDDEGSRWRGTLLLLKRALQSSIGGDALVRYVVVNIGFIAATADGASVHIRIRPSVASPAALVGLLYWLHDQRVERVLISYFDGDWSHVLLRSLEDTLTFLARRCDRASIFRAAEASG